MTSFDVCIFLGTFFLQSEVLHSDQIISLGLPPKIEDEKIIVQPVAACDR